MRELFIMTRSGHGFSHPIWRVHHGKLSRALGQNIPLATTALPTTATFLSCVTGSGHSSTALANDTAASVGR